MSTPDLVLYIGNCNYSSWSLRAWLALEQTELPFEEFQIWLDEDSDRTKRGEIGPTAKVPVLRDGDLLVWDSLAIGEYLAEIAPTAGLWPPERAARARARALCAEMHAGFQAIRNKLPMNVRARTPWRDRGAEVDADIRRIIDMWDSTRRVFGSGGPYLFGRRSLADAFYAPVVYRFRTYGVELEGEAAAWAETMLQHSALRRWEERAEAEGHAQPAYDREL